LFLTKDEAERLQIPYQNLWALITLKIHSDLLSCGFMAAVAQKLAAANIALNPVAGYFHDHLFVPYEKAEETLNLLGELSQSVRN